jgi:radical SAM superfamily enzyme YgiQ (UPF0313 family)
MNVVLISSYDLGRQPFGLASPAAWLKELGASVICLDLSLQKLDEEAVGAADLVAFFVPMHTATRLATKTLRQVKQINPEAHICFYGLYAPVNESFLRNLGAQTILGGEFEAGLSSLVSRLADARGARQPQVEPVISLAHQRFKVPDRSGLPTLSRYAYLQVGPGKQRTVGYTETTRGCKHLCRHCPIVPVYNGRFFVVSEDVVLEDIRRQISAGAQHITFGDPDFFNGPKHSIGIVSALHEKFPDVTYDATIKIEHLLKHRHLLPILRDTGCLFVTSAVESIDPTILEIFDKRHTREDFIEVVSSFRRIRLALNPTFVTFTPWTSLKSYIELLELVAKLDLIDHIAPIQYGIRLLIPAGSRLLELPQARAIIQRYSEEALSYIWVHSDPNVDGLWRNVVESVREGQERGESRRDVFNRVWKVAHLARDGALEEPPFVPRPIQAGSGDDVPSLSEPWYCCAEPIEEQAVPV